SIDPHSFGSTMSADAARKSAGEMPAPLKEGDADGSETFQVFKSFDLVRLRSSDDRTEWPSPGCEWRESDGLGHTKLHENGLGRRGKSSCTPKAYPTGTRMTCSAGCEFQ